LIEEGADISSVCAYGFTAEELSTYSMRQSNQYNMAPILNTDIGLWWIPLKYNSKTSSHRYRATMLLLHTARTKNVDFRNACVAELELCGKKSDTSSGWTIFNRLYHKHVPIYSLEVTPKEMFTKLIHQKLINSDPDTQRVFPPRLAMPL
jgi:hypothetical protein